MKKITFHLFLFISLFIQSNSFAKEIINELSIGNTTVSENRLSKKDAIIISEYNAIDISGEKADFIDFSFTKKIKFKVLSLAGINKFKKFILPETFDPTYIPHLPIDRKYAEVYSLMKCNFFKATIITKNGDKKDASIKHYTDQIKMVMPENDIYGNFEQFTYQIDNLAIGDEVSVEYNYDVPYKDNFAKLYCCRIFFNSDVFKQNYQLSITHSINLDANIFFKNNALPDSNIERDNKRCYYWKRSNLNGCINEEGSHPYQSLQHVILSIKPSTMLYNLPYSYDVKYIPFYALYSYIREKNHFVINMSVSQGVKSGQFLQIDKFIRTETEDIKYDSSGYQKLLKIHNKIVDEFKFDNDTNYFKTLDTRDPRMGDYVSMSAIRDISRYDLYVTLALKLNLNYFTAYTCDKRSGELNNEYYAPMYDNDYLIAPLLKDNKLHFILPKKAQFGYYLNEVPFYYEKANSRLVHINDYKNFRTPIEESLRQIQLPYNSMNDNFRKNTVLVKVDLDKLALTFDARISLSGQYSTITRGLYQYNYKDETINNFYHKKIWELNEKVQLLSKNVKVNTKESPFLADVNAQYTSNNILTKSGDTYSLNLKNWFNHIIYNDLDTNERQTDFYPDFKGRDSYVYYLQFDKNIKLISTLDSADLKNEFGELIISTEQASPNSIKLVSYFATTTNVVTVDKMADVKVIFDKLQKLNNCSIQFKIE